MDLKRKLDSIERTEILYIIAGILLLGLTAVGFQYQDADQQATGQATVSLTLDKPGENITRDVSLDPNSTAFEAINKSFEVEYKEYSFGYFITSIDGLKQNESHSWLYFVNGEPAKKAVNKYRLSEGDNVTFSYTSENPFE